MRLDRSRLLCSTIVAGLATVLLVPTASAQSTPAPSDQGAKPAPKPAATETAVTELIVTGSRIKRNEFNSSSPIQVILPDQGTARGISDTVELLQTSPLASGSPQINSTISTAFVTNGGPGAATVSLRGLGANRTLVLLNGRRAGPAGTRGAVSAFDLNVLPQSAIDHVEVLKDGASSVYGSDAIAGVVNIVTKKNADGFDFDAFGSDAQHSGGSEFELSGSWGKTFDRGYFNVSVDYYKQFELREGDRSFTRCAAQYQFDGSGQRNDVIDARTGKPACLGTTFGQLYLYDYGFNSLPYRLQYDATGQLGTLVPGTSLSGPNNPGGLGAPANWFLVGGPSHAAAPSPYGVSNQQSPQELAASVIPETRRITVFAQAGYDISAHIQAYGEVLMNRRETNAHGFRQFWTYTYGADAQVSADFGFGYDPFSAGFTGPYLYSPTPGTDHAAQNTIVNYARLVGGLKGDFGEGDFLKGWTWDLFAQYSRSDGAYEQDVILDDAVRSAAFRSDLGTYGGNGNSIPRPTASCVGYVTPVSGRPCIDIPWMDPRFLSGNLTPEEKAFLFDTETGHTLYTQTYVEGSATGNLFKLPAGPVGAAFGFHFRHDSINDVPGAVTLAGNSWGLSGAGITKGADDTKEVFGELQIPLLKGYPLIESLSASLSGRYTNVSAYGGNGTYKAGLNWQATPWARLRVTYGTSFRAPGLFELYLADETSFVPYRSVDPCINYGAGNTNARVAANCAAEGIPPNFAGGTVTPTVHSGGGFGIVKAETSKATTVGLVLTPSFADLSIAIDYFNIDISNGISQLGYNNIGNLCYNSLTYPTDPVCSLIKRDTNHIITDVYDNYINIASQKNRGIDLTVDYKHAIPWGSKLTLNGQFTWQLIDTTALFPGNVVDSNGAIGDPRFTGILNAKVDKGDWSATWSVEMIGPSSALRYVSNIGPLDDHYVVTTDFITYNSISLKRKFSDWSLTLGIRNLFDQEPPQMTTRANISGAGNYNTIGTSVLASQYDYVGRQFFVDLKKKF
ncbi:MAG TPA: TonB-dependent receptor [Caulobacteraceae bacterium]